MSIKLFENGTIITWDDSVHDFKILRHGSLLVEGNRVTAIWENDERPKDLTGEIEYVSIEGKILSPGLIDSHRHGWQAIFRTLAPNTHLGDYLELYGPWGIPMDHLTPDDLYWSTLQGYFESIDSGTTTIVENAHHNWDEQSARAGWNASLHSGARVHWAYAVGAGRDPAYDFDAQIELFRELHAEEAWRHTPADLGLNWEGFGENDTDLIHRVASLAKELNVSAVHANHLGSPLFGINNSPKNLLDAGLLNSSIPVMITHATLIDDENIALLREHNQYVVITPESEMQHGHGHRQQHTFLDQISLGVDNNLFFGTSMQNQGRLWLQATRRTLWQEAHALGRIRNTTGMDVSQAFHLITRSGGLALKRPDLGVIKVGALADLTVWDGDSPQLLGWSDPIAAIVLHSQTSDAQHVLVDGEWRKYDGKLLETANGQTWSTVKKNFLERAKRIHELWLTLPRPYLPEGEKFAGLGVEYISLPKVNVTREQYLGL
ncbi:Metallo-dependent hydrolase [Corynespora cassiicola Philippines]|uniref:Metallo-dependent hydrolase n=1 Tax=Corynespora cassiicola Philippines TaxID=1448308 RepID=A0A2T2N505_CORCC|nr:Metallo-dependent hydrolase [Corynespora cassiicola Philippines]